jgi:hypothetical protein
MFIIDEGETIDEGVLGNRLSVESELDADGALSNSE